MWRELYNHYRPDAGRKLIILIDEEKSSGNEEMGEKGGAK